MAADVITTPYGRPALDALRGVVAESKRTDPMSPVTILCPTTSPASSRGDTSRGA